MLYTSTQIKLINENYDAIIEEIKKADRAALENPNCEYQVWIYDDGDAVYEEHPHGDRTYYCSNQEKVYICSRSYEGFDVLEDWYYTPEEPGTDDRDADLEAALDAWEYEFSNEIDKNAADDVEERLSELKWHINSVSDIDPAEIIQEHTNCTRDTERALDKGTAVYNIEDYAEQNGKTPDELRNMTAKEQSDNDISVGKMYGEEYVIEWCY